MTTGAQPLSPAGSRIIDPNGVPLPEFGRWLDWMKRFSSDANSGQLGGTTTNDSARPGNVGEFLVTAATVGLVSGVPLTVTTIQLTAGDWQVYGAAQFAPAATTNITKAQASHSTVPNTMFFGANAYTENVWAPFVPNATISLQTGPQRQILAGPIVIGIVVQLDFTVSTASVTGAINALRVR